MKRFQVIGRWGDCYGESDTLRGAKQIATKVAKTTEAYMYSPTKPYIYLLPDCIVTWSGEVTNKPNAQPCSVWDGKTWEDFSSVFGEI